MATSKNYLDFILEQLSGLDGITYRAMMGEYIIYYRGKIAAYVCDERFLVKPLACIKQMIPDATLEPPYKGAKEMVLIEDVDNRDFLVELFNVMYDELPAMKLKGKIRKECD